MRVAIVNETAAGRLWPGEDAVGQRLWLQDDGTMHLDSAYHVVGIVADVQYGSIAGDVGPDVYTPYLQHTWPYTYVMVRSRVSADLLVPALRQAVARVDPEQPITGVRSLDSRIGAALAGPRLSALLLGGFAALALLLAAVGIYGAMAHYVAQRTRDLGVRMALGAAGPQVVVLVLRHGMVLVAAGALLGAIGALGVSRVLETLLYDVTTTDPSAFVAAVAVLASVALLACWVPARRAARLEPMTVLRAE
jgi:predicted lysophospholipase L1 biosynthesis ABC-type transport system permease subunit